MKKLDEALKDQTEILKFLKSRFPMYHLSNFFFRDVQYGVRQFLEEKGIKIGYRDAEQIARKFVEGLEQAKIFRPIDRQSWVVFYPDFRLPQSKPAAKPAAGAPAAQRAPAAPATIPQAVQDVTGSAAGA